MSDAKDTEDEYLATGFRNVHGAKIEKIMRCLDVLQPIECFQHYKDPSVDLLGGARDLSALDVACGLGDDVVRLKVRFGRTMEIDASSEFDRGSYAVTNRKVASCALPTQRLCLSGTRNLMRQESIVRKHGR